MYTLYGIQSNEMKINFQLKMLTHTHDECKSRFRTFDREFSGNIKRNTYSFEDNFLQINNLFIFSNTVLLRKVLNSR